MTDPYITNLMLLRAKQRKPLFLGRTALEVGRAPRLNCLLDRHELALRGAEPPSAPVTISWRRVGWAVTAGVVVLFGVLTWVG